MSRGTEPSTLTDTDLAGILHPFSTAAEELRIRVRMVLEHTSPNMVATKAGISPYSLDLFLNKPERSPGIALLDKVHEAVLFFEAQRRLSFIKGVRNG